MQNIIAVLLIIKGTYPIENKVTHHYQVNGCLATENGQHVGRHSLPKVNQKILNLQAKEKKRLHDLWMNAARTRCSM